MTLLAAVSSPHVRCATPFLLNLFRSCTLLIAAMPKGLAGEFGPSYPSSRFARRSRIPASFAMGFIPAITPRIYPPPVSNLILPPFMQLHSHRFHCARGGGSILLTLNLRPIHRNESKWRERERGGHKLINPLGQAPRQSRCRRRVELFDSHSPASFSRVINPRGFRDDDALNLRVCRSFFLASSTRVYPQNCASH